ncbi:hypothetical protein V1477_020454 [Vespula maculifrons]|uniref:Uncharacterized protein n=1 Tax=Vespula maculifrons TaxID=7453 RepID=A0ABD2ALY6_VESMC
MSYRGLRFIERRLFDHAGHANFRVETPSDRGSPTAATSTRSDVSSNGLVHIRLLDANTGRIERTFARVSAGTDVMFSGAINSPTITDFV